MVIYLRQGEDLRMAQLVPLPFTVSCSSKSRLVLPFCCRLIQVVLDNGQLNWCHRCHHWVLFVIFYVFGCIFVTNSCPLLANRNGSWHVRQLAPIIPKGFVEQHHEVADKIWFGSNICNFYKFPIHKVH